MELVEALLGEVLSRVRKNQVVVTDTTLHFLPPRVKDRGVDKSHTRDVGIGFGGYIESTGAGSFDHRKAFRGLAQTRAIDVHNMQRSTGDGRGGDYFTHGFDR